MIFNRVIVFLFCFFISLLLNGQIQSLKNNYTSKFEIDEMSIHLNNMLDFEFDEYGRAWVLLTNGLILYDGFKYEFIPFAQIGIPNYSFKEIIKNPSGGLFLLGYRLFPNMKGIKYDLKVIAFNTLLKSFQTFDNELNNIKIKSNDLINIFSFDTNLIGAIHKNGFFYTKNKSNWNRIFKIPHPQINTLFPAKNNQWHAFSPNTYYKVDEKGCILTSYTFKNDIIIDFIENKSNKDECFLQLESKVIFIDENAKVKSEVSFLDNKSVSLNKVLNLYVDNNGKFWLKYLNKVVVFDENGNFFQEFPEIKNIDFTWSGRFPIKEDPLGKIWIHLGKGFFINKLIDNDIQFYLKGEGYSFRGIQQMNDSILYFNSYKGIGFINMNNGKIEQFISNKYDFLGALFYEPNHKIYIGSNNAGYTCIDARNNNITLVATPDKNLYHYVFLQKGLRNKYFWVGDFGFQPFNLKNEKLDSFIKLPKNHSSISSFYEGYGYYLIGTDQGLLKYILETKKWIQLKDIPKIRVTGIVRAENKYFISTAGAGIFLLDNNHKKLSKRNFDLRGIHNVVFSMILGSDQQIWLGTEKGLYVLDPKKGNYQVFKYLDGVFEEEFNWLSTVNLKNGDIVMGTINGLVRFNPFKMNKSFYHFEKGNIFFPSLNVNNYINTKNRNGLYEYLNKGKITLNPNEYSITFSPRFTNNYIGKQLLFYVKMPNLEDWQLVRPNESITISPQPGKSEITFRIYNQITNGDYKEIKIPVFKLQHILENKVFLRLVFFLFASLIGIIFFLRYRLISGKNKELELDLAKRVNDLEINEKLLIDKNDKLAIFNEERRRFFEILGHEVKTPIAGMKQLSHTFNYLLNKGDYEKALKIAESLEQSGNEISHLVDNLLTWSNLEKNVQISKNIPFNILNSFSGSVDLFTFQIQRKNIQYHLSIENDFDGNVLCDPNIAGFIFRNILSNAIKYCPENGNINCSFKLRDDFVLFEMANTTAFLSFDKLFESIGNAPVPSLPGTLQERGLGIGLFMVHQLIERIKGKINFKIMDENVFLVTITFLR